MRAASTLIVAALLGASPPSHALTGNTLLEWLRSDSQSFKATSLMYIRGVADTDIMWAGFDALPEVKQQNKLRINHFCIPAAASADQLHDVVRTYLEAHPADRATIASQLVQMAMLEAFPCSK